MGSIRDRHGASQLVHRLLEHFDRLRLAPLHGGLGVPYRCVDRLRDRIEQVLGGSSADRRTSALEHIRSRRSLTGQQRLLPLDRSVQNLDQKIVLTPERHDLFPRLLEVGDACVQRNVHALRGQELLAWPLGKMADQTLDEIVDPLLVQDDLDTDHDRDSRGKRPQSSAESADLARGGPRCYTDSAYRCRILHDLRRDEERRQKLERVLQSSERVGCFLRRRGKRTNHRENALECLLQVPRRCRNLGLHLLLVLLGIEPVSGGVRELRELGEQATTDRLL